MKLDIATIDYNIVRLMDQYLQDAFESTPTAEKDLTALSPSALTLFAGQCDALLGMRKRLLEVMNA